MKYAVGALVWVALFAAPAAAFAAVTITSVTLDGGPAAHVQPGGTIEVSVTAVLTESSKWKGTGWSISNSATPLSCVNTQNSKDRNAPVDGPYTQTFTVVAPTEPGLYSATFLADGLNGCDLVAGALFSLTDAVQVGDVAPPPPEDTEPPEVVSFVPANASTDAALDSALTITFSEPLDPSSVTIDTVQLWRDAYVDPSDNFFTAARIDGSVSLSADGLTVTVVEGEALLPGRSYYFVVPGGTAVTVTDVAGNQPFVNLLDVSNARFTTSL